MPRCVMSTCHRPARTLFPTRGTNEIRVMVTLVAMVANLPYSRSVLRPTMWLMSNAIEPSGRMVPYSVEHVAMLIVTVVVAIVVVLIARRIRETAKEDRFLRVGGWIMLTVTLAWTAWGMLPGQWNIDQSLPFQFSDALRFATAIALLTRAGWAIAICYFWGLTLNLQSIITPDLNYFTYPVLEFGMYWFLHIAALVVPIMFVWGLGYRPTWRGYGVTYAATVGWAGIALAVNMVTGANYAYLSHAPAGPSVLDVLGPWPIYIFWEAVIIAVVWALITWPWETRVARAFPVADRWATVRRRPPSDDVDSARSGWLQQLKISARQ